MEPHTKLSYLTTIYICLTVYVYISLKRIINAMTKTLMSSLLQDD
nr:MAG TPA: hypothetical protein [Bacteriophage sp.]